MPSTSSLDSSALQIFSFFGWISLLFWFFFSSICFFSLSRVCYRFLCVFLFSSTLICLCFIETRRVHSIVYNRFAFHFRCLDSSYSDGITLADYARPFFFSIYLSMFMPLLMMAMLSNIPMKQLLLLSWSHRFLSFLFAHYFILCSFLNPA